MYTQCPDCHAAFLVTADDLKKAAGKVRCGGCGSAFDALLYLSESLPATSSDASSETPPPGLKPASQAGKNLLPESISADESIALLQTLDELAGADIRIEDTGIEWRVLDDGAFAELPTEENGRDAETLVAEVRYDDNSPLPEKIPKEDDAAETPEEPVQEAAADEPSEPVDDDDDFSETVGWDEIIDECDELAASNVRKEEAEDESDESVAENDAPPEPAVDSKVDEADDDAGPGSNPSQWELLVEDDGQEESLPTLSKPIKPDDKAVEEPVAADVKDGLWTDEDIGVESIVMEGETVRYALDDMEAAAVRHAVKSDTALDATSADSVPRARTKARRIGTVILAVLLLLVLTAQVVHQQRDTLAKIPAVNNLIGPLYRALGNPLVPAWDVTGWSFEATTGNADGSDQQLNIYSRIGNRSAEALPYPLIGISLTDRFEEVIGSRVLEPVEYLANSLNPRKMVAPGEAFDAFITIPSPDVTASGYKLDVCYRLPDRRLRCAIGDFK